MSTCHRAIGVLKTTTTVADALGLSISTVEAGLVDGPLVGGLAVVVILALFQPEILLGLPEIAPAFLAFDAGIANGLAPLENNLGYFSLATTTAADLLEGNTHLSADGDLYVGTATAISVSTAIAGTVPEANIDFAASAVQFAVDTRQEPLGSINLSQLIRNLPVLESWTYSW